MAQATIQRIAEPGHHIFIYHHARTNQTIYSLTRQINDTKALAQLPFLGKQTVPSSIRKDFWTPLASVSFPSAPSGLSCFQKLREFRKRHEHEWDWADMKGLSKKARGKKLRDQKANSVADLAAVLEKMALEGGSVASVDREAKREDRVRREKERLERVLVRRKEARNVLSKAKGEEVEKARETYRELKKQKMKMQKALAAASASPVAEVDAVGVDGLPLATSTRPTAAPKRGAAKQKPVISADGVKIQWANLLDAEYAATWPESVVHDVMPHGGNRGRYMAASVAKPAQVAAEIAGIGGGEVVPSAKSQVQEVPPTQPEMEAPEPKGALDSIVRRLQFGSK